MDINLTMHAEIRMGQRGVRPVQIELLIQFGDLETPCGRGSVSIAMTQRAYHKMLDRGVDVQIADRVRNLVTVIGRDGRVATVLHNHGRRGGHYIRDKRTSRVHSPRRRNCH